MTETAVASAPGAADTIVFEGVSKFYGEVLGVNRVDLVIEPGITGLVGPNGAGKSTLMNLMAGLLRPTRGSVCVLGWTTRAPEALYQLIGYCTQSDSFPPGVTGRRFLTSFLQVHGFEPARADELTQVALERVDMAPAADRRIDGYSKGMRQRIKLAQAICHEPKVIILDEPLNGLDPVARVDVIALFSELAAAGAHVLISSHILHELDLISDRVVFLSNGYVVAEGDVSGIQGEMTMHPIEVFIRSPDASDIAATLFGSDHVVQARLHDDGHGLFVHTRDADAFYLAFNDLVLAHGWSLEAIGPADETVAAVYRHLVVEDGHAS